MTSRFLISPFSAFPGVQKLPACRLRPDLTPTADGREGQISGRSARLTAAPINVHHGRRTRARIKNDILTDRRVVRLVSVVWGVSPCLAHRCSLRSQLLGPRRAAASFSLELTISSVPGWYDARAHRVFDGDPRCRARDPRWASHTVFRCGDVLRCTSRA
jgi:hypothetical protein